MRPILPRVLLRSTPSSLLTTPFRTLQSPALRTSLRQNVRYHSTSPPPPPSSLSFSARMKALSKEYGYAALGVYLGLSALDFPFCFLFVKWVGTERVGEWEEKIVGAVKPWWESAREKIGFPVKRETRGEKEVEAEREERREGLKGASIWTELALAYAIHKSFIFLRVPLTAAVTPKVVKVLKRWGWDLSRKGGPKRTKPTTPKKE